MVVDCENKYLLRGHRAHQTYRLKYTFGNPKAELHHCAN